MTELQNLICDFFDRGIIRLNLEDGFELVHHRTDPTAPRSPLYYNLRTRDNPKGGMLTHKDVQAVARLFCDTAARDRLSFAGIAPVPNAAIPFALEMQGELYSRPGHRNVPVLTFEKATGKLLRSRDLLSGNCVLLLDDVISDGESKGPLIIGIRESGYRVSRCLVFARRSKKGEVLLRQKFEVTLHYVTTTEETLEILREEKRISEHEQSETLRLMELV